MYRTALVALDGSKNAEKVLPYLEPILKSTGAKAVLIQAIPEGSSAPAAAAKAYLKSVVARLRRKKIACSHEILLGDPAVSILRAVESFDADLVAFTTHGKTGLARWVMGSVAQKIVRGCLRTLLVVQALEKVRAKIRRVVVPLDGSVGSEAIMPHAFAAARAYDANVQLVYVAHVPGIEAGDSKLRSWMDREKKRMLARLDEIVRSEPELKIEARIEKGDPALRILELAEERTPALIAMKSHGRTGFSRWVYGSVSEKVLQAAQSPVLIARHTPS